MIGFGSSFGSGRGLLDPNDDRPMKVSEVADAMSKKAEDSEVEALTGRVNAIEAKLDSLIRSLIEKDI